MLVHRSQQERAFASAKAAAGAVKVGDPRDPQTTMGPVVNEAQFKNVQRLIGSGIEAGATLVTGGLGCPDGLSRGY
jgi:aldehyde dehydrogenase (NAD+)